MAYAWRVAGVLLAGIPASCGGQPMGAYFERKDTVFTGRFETGPTGGLFRVPILGTPTDGVFLDLPEKAVEKPISLSVGYCTGSLKLRAGTASGIVLTIKTSPEVTFQQPLRIGVSFTPSSKHMGLVGYAISDEGRLRPIDILNLDMKKGRATFLSFQPLTLTWAYIDR